MADTKAAASDLEIVTTRLIPYSRDLVFKAWTDPAHLAQWWGPKGFTNTFHEFDPKPGGKWRFVMHGPDGANYENESVFEELTKPERIVLRHLSGPKFLLTGSFENRGGQTRITFRMRFETAEECEKVKGVVPEANEQNLDRLEAQLQKMSAIKTGS